ncbi:MAG: YchJ family metal-binding protein [Kofleriaceae bacterium]
MKPCPCGSGATEAACCGPLLAGEQRATTALALMRSRYTAYVRGNVDYLISTHAAETRTGLEQKEILKFTRATLWLGLEIVTTVAGGVADADGIVEFVASGVTRGQAFRQHERSRFRRDAAGAWCYVDGILG